MIVYIILALLIAALILLLFSDQDSVVQVKKRYYHIKKYQAKRKAKIQNDELNKQLKNAGFPFDLYRFQIARYGLTFILLILLLITRKLDYFNIFLVIAVYILTAPKSYFFRIRTPIKRFVDASIMRRKKLFNAEIGLFVIVMNNNFNIYKSNPPSGYKIVLDAMVGMKKIKPVFEQLLRYWQTNKTQEGVDYFVKTIGTEEANKLGLLLGKLNELHPNELKEQLIAQKEIFRKKRQTEKKNKIKNQNYIVFGLVASLLMIILLNITQGIIEMNGGISF